MVALIHGYARKSHGKNALDCLEQMQYKSILIGAVIYEYISTCIPSIVTFTKAYGKCMMECPLGTSSLKNHEYEVHKKG